MGTIKKDKQKKTMKAITILFIALAINATMAAVSPPILHCVTCAVNPLRNLSAAPHEADPFRENLGEKKNMDDESFFGGNSERNLTGGGSGERNLSSGGGNSERNLSSGGGNSERNLAVDCGSCVLGVMPSRNRLLAGDDALLCCLPEVVQACVAQMSL